MHLSARVLQVLFNPLDTLSLPLFNMAPTATTPSSLPAEAQALEKYFVLDEHKLNEIVKGFRQEFEDGLKHFGKDVAMIPSYCLNVPNGTEVG